MMNYEVLPQVLQQELHPVMNPGYIARATEAIRSMQRRTKMAGLVGGTLLLAACSGGTDESSGTTLRADTIVTTTTIDTTSTTTVLEMTTSTTSPTDTTIEAPVTTEQALTTTTETIADDTPEVEPYMAFEYEPGELMGYFTATSFTKENPNGEVVVSANTRMGDTYANESAGYISNFDNTDGYDKDPITAMTGIDPGGNLASYNDTPLATENALDDGRVTSDEIVGVKRFPVIGELGLALLGGHATTPGEDVNRRIDELKEGDVFNYSPTKEYIDQEGNKQVINDPPMQFRIIYADVIPPGAASFTEFTNAFNDPTKVRVALVGCDTLTRQQGEEIQRHVVVGELVSE